MEATDLEHDSFQDADDDSCVNRSCGSSTLHVPMEKLTVKDANTVPQEPLAFEFDAYMKPVYRDCVLEKPPLAPAHLGMESLTEFFTPERKYVSPSLPKEKKSTGPSSLPIVVRELEDYYDLAMTHFVLDEKLDISDASKHVDQVLMKHSVNFDFNRNKAKWKCCYGKNGCSISFVVHMWRKNDTVLVLEFLRRMGDAFKFMQIYRDVQAYFTAEGDATPTTPTSVSAPLKAEPVSLVPTYILDTTERNDTIFQKTLENIVDMVESGLLDSEHHGLQALAQLSSDRDALGLLSNDDTISMIVKYLDSSSELEYNDGLSDVVTMSQTSAVVSLANISEHDPRSILYDHLNLYMGFVKEGTIYDREMRQGALRILKNLSSKNNGAQTMIKKIGEDTLRSWFDDNSHITDLRNHLEEFQSRVFG